MKVLFPVFTILVAGFFFSSCSSPYDAKSNMTDVEHDLYLKHLAPYVLKKPDGLSFDDRFEEKAATYYQQLSEKTDSRITHFIKNDSVSFFFFEYRDLTSLYKHYRGMGGYFKTGPNDALTLVNLLYHTPRLTAEEITDRSDILFREMVTKGNVEGFIGNRSFIHTPNNDFYYNTQLNRWDYTANSSWSFLREEQERAAAN